MRNVNLALCAILSIAVIGCGGEGGSNESSTETSVDSTPETTTTDTSTADSSIASIDIVGEWDYTRTISTNKRALNCDKEENGVLTILNNESTYTWTLSSDNALSANCEYVGEQTQTYTLGSVNSDDTSYQTLLASLKANDSSYQNVIFNSEQKMTMNYIDENTTFTTIFQRDDLKFNNIQYSGTYTKTSGTNCQNSGTVYVYIENGEVKGSASTDYGRPLEISGFKISNGKYEGTTSDGTVWKGVVTSEKIYSTYLNTTYQCEGTAVASRVN